MYQQQRLTSEYLCMRCHASNTCHSQLSHAVHMLEWVAGLLPNCLSSQNSSDHCFTLTVASYTTDQIISSTDCIYLPWYLPPPSPPQHCTGNKPSLPTGGWSVVDIPGDDTVWGINSDQFIRGKMLGSEAFYSINIYPLTGYILEVSYIHMQIFYYDNIHVQTYWMWHNNTQYSFIIMAQCHLVLSWDNQVPCVNVLLFWQLLLKLYAPHSLLTLSPHVSIAAGFA